MRRTGWFALGLLAAAPAWAQLAGEHLAAPADPAMRLGFAQGGAVPMQEYVARGESVDAWTRMVTVQRLGWRPGVTPASFLRSFAERWAGTCPGAVATAPSAASLDGHVAADQRLDCPRNPQTGKPETAIVRVVLGDETMHMVQAATRRVPTAADLAWANGVIAGTGLCRAADTSARCRNTADPAAGKAP